jgi:HEAT repeat protein
LGIALVLLLAGAALARAQTHSKEILARPASELVELLQNPNASIFEKAKACQRLAVVGTKEAVPALVALLPDENLNVYGRFGLEGIPDPAVDAALREAATRLQGGQLVGVIDSIGQRKDSQAVELLQKLLGNADAAVASAAAGALGRIGTIPAAVALQEAIAKDSPVKIWIADAALACVDGLVAANKKAESATLLDAVGHAELPKHLEVAILAAQLRLQGAAGKDLLLAQIRNPDEAFFSLGLAAAREMPGADVTAALAAELDKQPPERQAYLLRALGDRKESAPMPAVLAASKSESPLVRQAAIYVLAKHGDASAAAVLLEAALGDAEVAATAQEGLKHLSGEPVDVAILARLPQADATAKVVLFDLLAARRIAAAAPTIRSAIFEGDPLVRLAAIAALGRLAEPADIDLLADKALQAGDAAEMAAAQASLRMAVLRMSDRDACAAKLASHISGASPENQAYLLGLLAKLSGPKALEIVAAQVKSPEPAVKDAASRVLGGWLSAEAAPILLEIVKNDADSKYQIRALRGYLRIARQLQLPAETKLAMFHTAMGAAKRVEEKRLALDVLTRIPSPATLTLAVAHLADAALKDRAADAAVKIAAKIVAQEPKAVAEAMRKVVDAHVADDVGNRARTLLGQAESTVK